MTPQLGLPCAPMPRKLRKTSVPMAAGKRRVNCTSATCATFGRMWRNRIRPSEKPSAFAARTYPRSRCAMTSARIRRHTPTHVVRPMARNTPSSPLPTTIAMASTNSNPGIDANVVDSHTTASSVFPPKYPPKHPSRTPSGIAMSELTTPTSNAIPAPCASRSATSRPSPSVPSQWAAQGGM